MKKYDFILVISILFISICMFFYSENNKRSEISNKYVSIQINGKEVDRYKFSNIKKPIRKEYKAYKGYNIVEISDNSVRMHESDCRDQICVHSSPIKNVGETIICLPHRFVIEIKEDNSQNLDIIVR